MDKAEKLATIGYTIRRIIKQKHNTMKASSENV
jgi:hypothetical protein